MNCKHRLIVLGVILSFTLSAWAQSQEEPPKNHYIDSLLWSIVPLVSLVAFAAFIWFFLIKRLLKNQDEATTAKKQPPGNDRKTS